MGLNLPRDLEADILARGTVGSPVKIPSVDGEESGGAGMPAGKMTGQEAFAAACVAAGLPRPEFEYRFDDTRRWRFDIAWPARKVAVEVQGGLFSGGRHVRGASLRREYEKLNTAAIGGWCVLLVTTGMVESGECLRLVTIAIPAPRRSSHA